MVFAKCWDQVKDKIKVPAKKLAYRYKNEVWVVWMLFCKMRFYLFIIFGCALFVKL